MHQTFFNDPDIHSKLNLKKPVNFIIHGWLGGLDGVDIYVPDQVKQSAGIIHRLHTYLLQLVLRRFLIGRMDAFDSYRLGEIS